MSIANVVQLLPTTVIGANGAGNGVDGLHRYDGVFGLLNVTAVPAGGAPTLNCYVQASPDGGTTWRDVASFQFAGVAAVRMFQLNQSANPALTTMAASDGALASDTTVQGPFGDRLRVKYVFAAGGSAGTYTLSASVVPFGGP